MSEKDTNNIKLLVRAQEEISTDEAAIVYKNLQDGFSITMPELTLKNSDFLNFVSDIKQEVCSMIEHNYSIQKNKVNTRYFGSDVRMYVYGNSKDISMNIYTKSEETNHFIWELYKRNKPKSDDIEILMTSFSIIDGRLSDDTREIEPKDIEYIQKEFYPYIDTNIMFDQFFTGTENILLAVGDPGKGKSKLAMLALKYAHENPHNLPYDKLELNGGLDAQFVNCAYVKSVDVLVNDQFWRNLEFRNMDFVIIDDLDYMLTKRDSETTSSEDAHKNIFLNQFLSFTDGVEKNKTKFIITTNQQYTDIDSALLRKGRLFDIIELRSLTKQEGLKIWLNHSLMEDDYNKLFVGDGVLAADLGSEISKQKNNRIETATASYMKEEGISKVQVAGRSKRIK